MGGSLAEAGLGLIAQRRPGGSLHSELTPLRGHSCRRGAGLVRGEPCVMVCTRALTYGIRPLTPGHRMACVDLTSKAASGAAVELMVLRDRQSRAWCLLGNAVSSASLLDLPARPQT